MQAAVPAHLLLLFLIQRQLGIRLRLRGGHISLVTLLIGIAAGQAGRRGRQAEQQQQGIGRSDESSGRGTLVLTGQASTILNRQQAGLQPPQHPGRPRQAQAAPSPSPRPPELLFVSHALALLFDDVAAALHALALLPGAVRLFQVLIHDSVVPASGGKSREVQQYKKEDFG